MLNLFSFFSHLPEIFLVFVLLFQIIYVSQFVDNSIEGRKLLHGLNEVFGQTLFALLLLAFLITFNFFDSNSLSLQAVLANEAYVNKALVVFFAVLVAILLLPAMLVHGIAFAEYYSVLLSALIVLLIIIEVEDLMLFYLLVETQALCFYILATINKQSIFSVEAGLKYFISGAYMSTFLLLGFILAYLSTGALNLIDIQLVIAQDFQTDNSYGATIYPLTASIALVSSALLFKIASGPFHFWMPDVYEGAPIASTLVFSVLPKYSLVYFFNKWLLAAGPLMLCYSDVLIWTGILSTGIGTLYAFTQKRIKRMLVYSTVAQIGFVVAGLSVVTAWNQTIVFFFILMYILTSFLMWGYLIFTYNVKSKDEFISINRFVRSRSLHITDFFSSFDYSRGGVWIILVIVIFFSIGGIPPFGGFISKLAILDGLVLEDELICSAALIILSSISVYYYIRILKIMFFEKSHALKNKFSTFKNRGIASGNNWLEIAVVFSFCIFLLIALFFNPSLPLAFL